MSQIRTKKGFFNGLIFNGVNYLCISLLFVQLHYLPTFLVISLFMVNSVEITLLQTKLKISTYLPTFIFFRNMQKLCTF